MCSVPWLGGSGVKTAHEPGSMRRCVRLAARSGSGWQPGASVWSMPSSIISSNDPSSCRNHTSAKSGHGRA